jgi:membrane associated rhomboid family serine protease
MFVDLPTRKRPGLHWATPLLAVLFCAGYLWLQLLPDDPGMRATLLRWGAVSGNASYWRDFWHDGRAFTLITALFLHANLWHLIGNGLFLLIFGVPAERALGPWRLLVVFLVGGALANLAAALLMESPGRVIIGASGGISALVGAYLVLFPKARLGVVVPLGLWLEFVRAPAALLIGLWALLQLIFSFVGPSFGAVAWWAHLAGFVIGAIMALAFRPGVTRRRHGR